MSLLKNFFRRAGHYSDDIYEDILFVDESGCLLNDVMSSLHERESSSSSHKTNF